MTSKKKNSIKLKIRVSCLLLVQNASDYAGSNKYLRFDKHNTKLIVEY